MYSGKELAIRAAIGVVAGASAMLVLRGWPTDAEKTATVVVVAVTGGLALVVRALSRKRRIQWQQSGERQSGPDLALWGMVGVIFVVFVALFFWLMFSSMQAAR